MVRDRGQVAGIELLVDRRLDDVVVRQGLDPILEVPVTIRYSQDTLAKGQSSWNALRIVSQLLLGRMVK